MRPLEQNPACHNGFASTGMPEVAELVDASGVSHQRFSPSIYSSVRPSIRGACSQTLQQAPKQCSRRPSHRALPVCGLKR